MIQWLQSFFASRWYWFAVFAVGALLEAVALFYQYVLGEPPCVLCIQVRFWVMVGMLCAVPAMLAPRRLAVQLVACLGLLISLLMMLNRSYIAVLVERSQYDGQCGMDPGFPGWLPLDVWLPALFEVWTMCGYTPQFLLGLTMGEALVISALLLLAVALLASFFMIRDGTRPSVA